MEEASVFEQEGGVFWRSKKNLGIGNGIGNLVKHLPLLKEYIFSIGDDE